MRVHHLAGVLLTALAMSISANAADSPVADAAMHGDQAAVESLIRSGADVNARQADGATALHWAVHKNDLTLTEVLIGAGADVKASNRNGATPLFLASENGNAAIIEMLLRAGADANARGPYGDTALMMASRTGNVDAIKILLDHGADIHASELLRGTTALMWAVTENHPAAVRLLVEHGADVSAVTSAARIATTAYLAPPVRRRTTPAGAPAAGRPAGGGGGRGAPAAGRGEGGQDAGQDRTAGADQEAAGGGNTPAQRDSNAGTGGTFGRAALASADPLTLTEAELAALAAINNQGTSGFFTGPPNDKGGGLTPLVFAARENCLECTKTLLEAGADVNQTTRYGWTPLLTAIQNRNYRLASYLLDNGADPNIVNNGGWSPLYIATDNRNIEGGDYPVRPADMDHLEFITKLLDRGADVNVRVCGVDSTPAQCRGDSTETRTIFTMQWLREDGATPFFRAAQSGDVDLMKLLLARGADPAIPTTHNVTPLAAASGIGWVEGVTYEWSEGESAEAVEILLEMGADPNAVSDEGRAPLHGAAHKGRNAVVQLLVDAGARLDQHDFGSRDTGNGDMLGHTWIPLNYAEGLVRVGVQSPLAHPETAALIRRLMAERGLEVPPPITSSICVTQLCEGAR